MASIDSAAQRVVAAATLTREDAAVLADLPVSAHPHVLHFDAPPGSHQQTLRELLDRIGTLRGETGRVLRLPSGALAWVTEPEPPPAPVPPQAPRLLGTPWREYIDAERARVLAEHERHRRAVETFHRLDTTEATRHRVRLYRPHPWQAAPAPGGEVVDVMLYLLDTGVATQATLWGSTEEFAAAAAIYLGLAPVEFTRAGSRLRGHPGHPV
jgi:hypothetical protein